MKTEYICRRVDGVPLHPDYVSHYFKYLLNKNNMKPIRFHDLRHSLCSFLLSKNRQLKDIQEWLGHSNISTTADIYGHLQYQSKVVTSNEIDFKL